LEQTLNENPEDQTLSRIFVPPPESAMTRFDLEQAQFRLNNLSELISKQNRGPDKNSQARLATLVMLNPYAEDYESNLDKLLSEMGKDDPLRDNVLLEKTRLIPDEQHRAEEYGNLHRQFRDTDGGIAAFYDLALLRIGFWRQRDQNDAQRKKEQLIEARNTLGEFVKMYPDNFRTHLAQETLNKLPAATGD
jgi:hypothetical protein